MIPKPPGCRGCPWANASRAWVPDRVYGAPRVWLVGQNPGAEEEAQGEPWVGSAGRLLHRLIGLAGLQPEEVGWSNAIRCRWQGTNTMGPGWREAAQWCRQYDRVPASVTHVIAAGSVAWEALGQGTRLWRGAVGPRPWAGRPVYGVWHPADLCRTPAHRVVAGWDWAKAGRWLAGTWPRPRPEPVPGVHWLDVGDPVVLDLEYEEDSGRITLVGLYDGTLGWQGPWDPALGPWLLDRQVVAYNAAGAELPVLARYGIPPRAWTARPPEDPILMHAVLWSELPHDLEFVASCYGPYGHGKHLKGLEYNWADLTDTWAVWQSLRAELARDPGARAVYETLRHVVPVVAESQVRGIRVDRQAAQSLIPDLHGLIAHAQVLAQAWAGWPVQLSSTPQVLRALTRDRLPVKGSIQADAIEALRQAWARRQGPEPEPIGTREALEARVRAGAHPVLEARVAAAGARQLLTHYVEPMTQAERVYPQVHLHAQKNARWSTVDPPLAQLPPGLRHLLVPDPGEVWIGWDWDQIELRLVAVLAGDEPLLLAFKRGEDIHTLHACELFGLPYPPDRRDPHRSPEAQAWRETVRWVGKDDPRRHFAKRYVYRLNYGGDPKGMIPGARQLGLDRQGLARAADRYLAAHPGLARWRQAIAEAVQGDLPVLRTWAGRPRRLLARGPALFREALNAPIQTGVSDLYNAVVVAIATVLPTARYVYGMHDSQVWGVPADEAPRAWACLPDLVTRPRVIQGRTWTTPATWRITCPAHLDCRTAQPRPGATEPEACGTWARVP